MNKLDNMNQILTILKNTGYTVNDVVYRAVFKERTVLEFNNAPQRLESKHMDIEETIAKAVIERGIIKDILDTADKKEVKDDYSVNPDDPDDSRNP